MAIAQNIKDPAARMAEGMWKHVFGYHPFEAVLDRAEGLYLYDTEGNRYLDVSGGPIAMNMAHGDRRILDAIERQAEKYTYCHPVLSSEPRAQLCERIAQVTPGDLNTTYLVSGGSEAVETAIKLARQYHLACGRSQKHKVISTWDSYHGMSLGALSVSGGGFRKPFAPMLMQWPHVHHYHDQGWPEGMSEEQMVDACAAELEEAIVNGGPDQISAFLATPVGAGKDYGLMPPASYWEAVREICDRYEVLLIADEVVTGFGRTGRWFAMEHFGVQADIMTTGKGISGLYAPLGGVTVSDRINEPFASGKYFIHGFTNQGHPLACAAGLATIDILEQDGLIQNSADVGGYLHQLRDRLLAHPTIADVRGNGLLMIPELVKNKETMEFFAPEEEAEHRLQVAAMKNGLVLYMTLYGPRQAGGRRGLPLFISPPLRITRREVDELLDRFDKTLTDWEREMGV